MPFTVTMPKLSPTMEEGTVARWLKKEGEFVEAGTAFIEIATDKSTVEYAALDEGWLRQYCAKEGESVRVNYPLALFSADPKESLTGYTPQPIVLSTPGQIEQTVRAPAPPVHALEPGRRIYASPLAKKLAEQRGLDLRTIQGSGPGGRIVSKDLAAAKPLVPSVGEYQELKLSPVRKIIASRLQESKSTIPHFYLTQHVEASALLRLKEELKELDLKVSVNDLIIRASALALREHPEVNRGFNPTRQTLILYPTIDISVAVTLEEGLITPIIFQADQKSVSQISIEMKQLAKKAREGKLLEGEYQGGSFCLSNLGMYGIDSFAAIINPPQGAILAVGAIVKKPVVVDESLKVGQVMELTLSADHRVMDGSTAAQFMKTLQRLLENPTALML